MRQAITALAMLAAMIFGAAAQAQQMVWVQIEAQPTLVEGEERARAYAAAFPDVAGFQMTSGWYAIALGPYPRDTAVLRLADLRAERLIPSDSYLNDGANYRQPFWPVSPLGAPLPEAVEVAPLPELLPDPLADPLADPFADPLAQPLDPLAQPLPDATATEDTALAPLPEATPGPLPETLTEPLAETVPAPLPLPLPEETVAEARASESLLTRGEREALQVALQWYGFYTSAIDGAFGPGTRNSMAAWQEANAYEPTGVLTTTQRAGLLAGYDQAQAEMGLETVTEAESGIAINLPLAMVQFDHYEPPFVHFSEKASSGVRVILISQPGDQGTLYGLYDVLQTLEDVPLDGARERRERSFTIEGRSAAVASYTYAELSQGLVKGYMLIWNPRDDEKMARVLAAMQSSFRSVGDTALDPGLVVMPDAAKQGLLAGLELRRPKLSRSGFFVDGAGAVLTTAEAVEQCARVTLDRDVEAEVVFADAALGVALVRPQTALAPRAFAHFQTSARAGAEVAVAGYSYEDKLPAPTLTFGTLDDLAGLNGEPGLRRLNLPALPGDAGGPLFDGAGAVLGMLLPKVTDPARQLPAEVSFALAASALTTRLADAGVTATTATPSGAVAPEDLTRIAEDMTVLVSCWN